MLTHQDLVELLKTTRASGKGHMLFTVFAQYHRMHAVLDNAASSAEERRDECALFEMLRAAYLEVKGIDFMRA